MRYAFLLGTFFLFSICGCAQTASQNKKDKVGGPCEGCEAIFESPVPLNELDHIDTLPDFNEPGPKMEVSGVVYKKDGETPAGDVVIYVYHTDQTGIYPKKEGEKGWAGRHGYIRGWVKTNTKGEYHFYTLRPGAYPGGKNPEHIHVTVKEPGKNEYYIDEYHFADDPILQKSNFDSQNRGGSGIVKAVYKNGRQYVTRDIVLGLNIPGYDD